MKRSMLPGALAATALVLTACSSSGSSTKAAPAETPAPTTGATIYGCLTQEQSKGAFTLDAGTAGGSSLKAYYRDSDAGGAKTAVIFSHQLSGSLCEWAPYFADFTKSGYAVLAFTSENDVTEGIKAAAGKLKEKGVTGLALIGASKGGTASLVAANQQNPLPVKAVVSLSAPDVFPLYNAAVAVKSVKIPTYFAAEEMDAPFNANAKSLYEASAAEDKQLKIYPGVNHGSLLLKDGALPDVKAYLAKHAPAAG
ncbi:dienelactone hydrolase family protein [Kitasatospora sp. NPDC059795]|uniref:dienelactone hydrolase family protein n=1 Tax=Kitasatospora sp. NPDC059795 TaxID=3346949 RepID=UPI0036570A33